MNNTAGMNNTDGNGSNAMYDSIRKGNNQYADSCASRPRPGAPLKGEDNHTPVEISPEQMLQRLNSNTSNNGKNGRYQNNSCLNSIESNFESNFNTGNSGLNFGGSGTHGSQKIGIADSVEDVIGVGSLRSVRADRGHGNSNNNTGSFRDTNGTFRDSTINRLSEGIMNAFPPTSSADLSAEFGNSLGNGLGSSLGDGSFNMGESNIASILQPQNERDDPKSEDFKS
jgi:hypothetical protein